MLFRGVDFCAGLEDCRAFAFWAAVMQGPLDTSNSPSRTASRRVTISGLISMVSYGLNPIMRTEDSQYFLPRTFPNRHTGGEWKSTGG